MYFLATDCRKHPCPTPGHSVLALMVELWGRDTWEGQTWVFPFEDQGNKLDWFLILMPPHCVIGFVSPSRTPLRTTSAHFTRDAKTSLDTVQHNQLHYGLVMLLFWFWNSSDSVTVLGLVLVMLPYIIILHYGFVLVLVIFYWLWCVLVMLCSGCVLVIAVLVMFWVCYVLGMF